MIISWKGESSDKFTCHLEVGQVNSFLSVPIVGVVHFNAMVCDWICFLDSIVLGSIADSTDVFGASGNATSNDINHDSMARRMPNDYNSYTYSVRIPILTLFTMFAAAATVSTTFTIVNRYRRAGARKMIIRTAPPSSTMIKRVQTHNDWMYTC